MSLFMTAAAAAVTFGEKGKHMKMLLDLMNQRRIIHNTINREWETNLPICAVPKQILDRR